MGKSRRWPLRKFLDKHAGKDLASFDELRGFIVAVAGTPDLVSPSEWLPEAMRGRMPEFDSVEHAQACLEDARWLYNAALQGRLRRTSLAPAFRKDILANFEDDAPIGAWCRGLARGHCWLQDDWDEYMPDELGTTLAALLTILTFFASRAVAEAFHADTGGGLSFLDHAKLVRMTFPEAMFDYGRLGRTLYQARLGNQPTPTEQEFWAEHGRKFEPSSDLTPIVTDRRIGGRASRASAPRRRETP